MGPGVGVGIGIGVGVGAGVGPGDVQTPQQACPAVAFIVHLQVCGVGKIKKNLKTFASCIVCIIGVALSQCSRNAI